MNKEDLPEVKKARFHSIVEMVIRSMLKQTGKYGGLALDDEVQSAIKRLLELMGISPKTYGESGANKFKLVHTCLIRLFAEQYQVNLNDEENVWLLEYLNNAAGAEWARDTRRATYAEYFRNFIEKFELPKEQTETFISMIDVLLTKVFMSHPNYEGPLQEELAKRAFRILMDKGTAWQLGDLHGQEITKEIREGLEVYVPTPQHGCKKFKELLGDIVSSRGVKKIALASKLNIAPGTISEWEKDRCPELGAESITAALIEVSQAMGKNVPNDLLSQVTDALACTCFERDIARHQGKKISKEDDRYLGQA
ncbi:MAG: hypothetical protein IAE83_21090 [Anaerolinea sp.]|nr:hypothetical protein [Anaerolinea sp.]